MHTVVNIVIAALGVYLIYEAIKMKKTNKISSFVVDEHSLSKCKDMKAFSEYLSPKLFIFAVILTITAIISIVDTAIYDIGHWKTAVTAVAITAFFLFYTLMRKGKKKFCS